MSDIGENPIKLLRSILIHYPHDYGLPIHYPGRLSYYYQKSDGEILKYDFKELWENMDISGMCAGTGGYRSALIYLLGVYHDRKWILQLTMQILAAFLGSTNIIHNNDNLVFGNQLVYGKHMKNEVNYLVIGEGLKSKSNFKLISSLNAIELYEENLKSIKFYITEGLGRMEINNARQLKNKERKEAVIIFLQEFCGFHQDGINFFMRKAENYRLHVTLKNLFDKNFLDCVPLSLYDNYRFVMRSIRHGDPLFNDHKECAHCWIANQIDFKNKKCKQGHNLLLENNLLSLPATVKVPSYVKMPPSPIKETPVPSAPDLMCSICMENEKNHTIIPCGHCYCSLCIEKLAICPDCRGPISKYIKIFV